MRTSSLLAMETAMTTASFRSSGDESMIQSPSSSFLQKEMKKGSATSGGMVGESAPSLRSRPPCFLLQAKCVCGVPAQLNGICQHPHEVAEFCAEPLPCALPGAGEGQVALCVVCHRGMHVDHCGTHSLLFCVRRQRSLKLQLCNALVVQSWDILGRVCLCALGAFTPRCWLCDLGEWGDWPLFGFTACVCSSVFIDCVSATRS